MVETFSGQPNNVVPYRYVDCTVQHSTYAGRMCQQPGLVIPQPPSAARTARQTCRDASDKWAALPTLDYGQTRCLGPITCDSEPTGMTCTDTSTGHFLRVSRESYQLG